MSFAHLAIEYYLDARASSQGTNRIIAKQLSAALTRRSCTVECKVLSPEGERTLKLRTLRKPITVYRKVQCF